MQHQFKPEEIQAALEKVLADPRFLRSPMMRTLLRFTVERTVAGRADELKEVVLGVEALERGTSFDPKNDPVVRVQMSRIRNRLAEYYGAEGSRDALRVRFPKGSYVPEFVRKDAAVPMEAGDAEEPHIAALEAPVTAAASPAARSWISWVLALAGLCALGIGWLYASRNANYAATAREKAEESYRLGNYLRLKQKSELYPQAEVAYQRAVELDPSHLRAQVWLAAVRLFTAVDHRKAVKDARAAADKVLAADPKVAEAYSLRSRIRCFYDYDWDGALEDARVAVRWAPESDASYATLAGVLQTIGRLDEALQPMRRAAELAPGDETNWYNLADQYWRMRRQDAALLEIGRLVTLNSDFPLGHRLPGRIHLSAGNAAHALSELEQGPQPPDVHRATALYLLGRTAEAHAIVALFEADSAKMFAIVR